MNNMCKVDIILHLLKIFCLKRQVMLWLCHLQVYCPTFNVDSKVLFYYQNDSKLSLYCVKVLKKGFILKRNTYKFKIQNFKLG